MAALVKAIEQRRFKQAKLLLQLGDDVNQQEKLSGRTPLLAVCFLDDENVACRITKKLLNCGADVCVQDVQGMSPLMQACKLGKEKLAKVLIQSEECDFGATDITGNTALIHSVDAGNSRITKALTEAMNIYDVRAADKPNKKGETPLIRAMKLKQDACREVLLCDGKASPHARDFDLKLNAKEWKLYVNEREEKERRDEAKREDIMKEPRKAGEDFDRKQIKDHCERSRTSSSIINYRQNLTSMTFPERRSVSFTPDSKKITSNETFLRRTKSAPLVKDENHIFFSRSVTFNFEPSNAENCISKSVFPEKKNNVCFAHKSPNVETISKQNGGSMATTAWSNNKHDTSLKVERGGRLGTKDLEALPSTATEQQKMTSKRTSGSIGEKTSCSQNQLPQLFSLMTQQATHSFRSSAKRRTSEETCDRGKSREGLESTRRRTSRRNSSAMQRKCFSGRRRWSTVAESTSLIALGRFSSLYCRSDFKALNPDNLVMMEKVAPNSRRSSIQSTTEELSTNRDTKAASISPNLVKLNPELSVSFPQRSTSNRIKSARPRYARQNSDSFLSTGRFQRAVTSTPVIEEAEES